MECVLPKIHESHEATEIVVWPTLLSVRALITMPSADNDLLIFFASSNVWPEAPVFPTFSDPARSTR